MTEGEKRVCAEQEGMTDAVCCGLDATAEGGDFWGAAYYKLLAGGARPALSVFAVCDERESSPPLFAMRKSDKEVLFSFIPCAPPRAVLRLCAQRSSPLGRADAEALASRALVVGEGDGVEAGVCGLHHRQELPLGQARGPSRQGRRLFSRLKAPHRASPMGGRPRPVCLSVVCVVLGGEGGG
eukprot:2847153-Rhodomonas_salina.1